MKSNKAQIRKFIEKAFPKMLDLLPYDLRYDIEESKKECNNSGGEFAIFIEPSNTLVKLFYYQDVFKLKLSESKNYLMDCMAHEVGHIVIEKLNMLIVQKYVSEKEHHKILEETATHISWIISKLYEKS